MANIFIIARHHVDNLHIVVSRNGRAPFTMVPIREIERPADDQKPLSFHAVEHWLADKGMVAAPIELERKPSLETAAFPYTVRVRCLAGVEP